MVEREQVSYGERLRRLAAERGDEHAMVFVPLEGREQAVTWRELDDDSSRIARLLQGAGVGAGHLVAIGLPAHPDHVKLAYAAWKLGACVMPVSHRAPALERRHLFDLAAGFRPTVTVGEWDDETPATISWSALRAAAELDAAPLADAVADPGRAICSGGTTGQPKLTVFDGPHVVRIEDGRPVLDPAMAKLGLELGHVQMVCTPLYHTSGFGWTHTALSLGNLLVLVERFDANRVLDAVERFRVNHTMTVPEILRRLLDVPDLESRDLSSWVALNHGGAPCPDWVKRRWFELIGPEHVYEGLGATEPIGATIVRGDEWLAHPGTVGRPVNCDVRILDDAGSDLPVGEVGEIYMRPIGATEPAFRYVGAQVKGATPDGFVTLGDFGWLDPDGFVYVADRRTDMIITGGANVYPAEVEAALSEHPLVHDVGVVGLPDEQWGRRVHAVVQPTDPAAPPSIEELDRHCRDRLAPYKVPKTYQIMAELPRSDVGKLRRGALRDKVLSATP